MITPKEIQKQCLAWWKEVLLAYIDDLADDDNVVSFFPREISRIGKISSKDVLNKVLEYKKAIELLQNDAKNDTKESKKFGYKLVLEEQQFAKIGKQPVPTKIIIESIKDYLKITNKEKEYQLFRKNYAVILKE